VIELEHEEPWLRQVTEQGFATVPAVLSARELIPLLVGLADLSSHRTRAGIRHALNHPAVKTISHDLRMLSLAQKILGASAFPFRATLFDKSPDSNWLITWHQDTALPLAEKHETPRWGPWSVKDDVTYAHAPASALEQVVALRLHLDDSTHENGPLRVLPGTHRMGVLSDEQVEREVASRKPVECLVNKGGVVAMRPLIIHASSKSQLPAPRRVLHVEYAKGRDIGDKLSLALV
jgi:ectoine hydroxylase-related dioxygenase (phytanoyl-CoA dioxygenase family)